MSDYSDLLNRLDHHALYVGMEGHTNNATTSNLLIEAAAALRDHAPQGLDGSSDIAKLLQNPAFVHLNMLRGGIAKLSWANIKHLYPEQFAENANSSEVELPHPAASTASVYRCGDAGCMCAPGTSCDPAPPNLETLGAALDVIMNASCDEQMTAATSIAGNIGMVLVNEPPHPDSPHTSPNPVVADYATTETTVEPVAWEVWWGIGEMRRAGHDPFRLRSEAEAFATTIKSNTEVRPLYAAPTSPEIPDNSPEPDVVREALSEAVVLLMDAQCEHPSGARSTNWHTRRRHLIKTSKPLQAREPASTPEMLQWVERDGARITLWLRNKSGTHLRYSVPLESSEGDVLVDLEAALSRPAHGGWSFDMEAAPKDRDLILAYDEIAAEGYFNGENETWWLANTAEHDFDPSRPIYPYAWREMPKAPADPRNDRGSPAT